MIFLRSNLRCIQRKALTLIDVLLGMSAQGRELLTIQGDNQWSISLFFYFWKDGSVLVCDLLFIIILYSPCMQIDTQIIVQYSQYSVITMTQLLCLAMLIPLVLSACASQCGSCSIDQNPYTCLTCPSGSGLSYLSSCTQYDQNHTPFIALVVAVTLIHLFMLAMGIGIYRQIFQNIQMVSLITWRYGFEGGSFVLQGTNLAIVRSNQFIEIFGFQFLALCILLLFFWLALALVGNVSQSPTAILLRRKRIIFPVRVLSFVYNILLFASLAQLSNIFSSSIKTIPFALGLVGLLACLATLIFVGVVSNNKKFQVDDPHYYVLVQQMVKKQCLSKNNTFILLLTRTGIIFAFVLLFQMPQIAGMIMLAFQFIYTLYFIATIRFTKIRYFLVLAINCLILMVILLTSYLGSVAPLYSSSWIQASRAYLGLYVSLTCLFLIASLIQVFLRKDTIVKQIKSIYARFLKCEQIQEKIVVSKYDEGSHREKVTDFHKNLLYKKEEKQSVRIEMSMFP